LKNYYWGLVRTFLLQGAGIWEGGREKRKGEGDDVDCGEKFEREA
jgi:hypothetical protein